MRILDIPEGGQITGVVGGGEGEGGEGGDGGGEGVGGGGGGEDGGMSKHAPYPTDYTSLLPHSLSSETYWDV